MMNSFQATTWALVVREPLQLGQLVVVLFVREMSRGRRYENTRNCVTRAPLAPRVDEEQARRGAGTSQSSYYYYYSSMVLTHESPTVPLVLLGPGSGFFCFLSRFHSQTFTDTPLV